MTAAVLFGLGLTASASHHRDVVDLNIVNAQIAPDGFQRDAVLANGTFPGPPIIGHKVSPI